MKAIREEDLPENVRRKIEESLKVTREKRSEMMDSIKAVHGEEMAAAVQVANEILGYMRQMNNLVRAGHGEEFANMIREAGSDLFTSWTAVLLMHATDRSKPVKERVESAKQAALIARQVSLIEWDGLEAMTDAVMDALPKTSDDNE